MSNKENVRVDVDEVIIRPWPKVILLYPTAISALVCGLIQAFGRGEAPTAPDTFYGVNALGLAFFIVFALNLLVFSFEFSRLKSLTIALAGLAVVFLCLWLGEKWPVVEWIREFIKERRFALSTQLYLGLFIYFLGIFVGVFINTRFNYYEIKHNEILHHTGFLGHVKRFPSPNLKMTKEINDVFEYVLLRSGRMILFPATEREAIVLENVLNVNAKEKDVHELLSSLAVEIETPGQD